MQRATRIAVLAFLAVAACSVVPISPPLSSPAPAYSIPEGEQWDAVTVCGHIFLRLENAVGPRHGRPFEMVLPGYDPFFSTATPKMSLRFVTVLFLLVAGSENAAPSRAVCGERPVRKSTPWYDASNGALARAVEGATREEGVSRRVSFAPIPVLAENACGAPQGLLWRVTEHDNTLLCRDGGSA